MGIVTHKQIYKAGLHGGTVNTTLCGRVSDALPDGMNVGENVTCKLCLAIIADPKHWRHVRYLTRPAP